MAVELVRVEVSQNMVQLAIDLAEDVESGRPIGVLLCKLYRRRKFDIEICGEAGQDPAFAHIAASVLQAELMDMIRGGGKEHTLP